MTTFSGSFVIFSGYSFTVVLCEFFDNCFFGGCLTAVSLVFSCLDLCLVSAGRKV